MKTTRQKNNYKGTYALFMTLPEDLRIETGSLGEVFYEAGEYCYVGSAMNGLRHRILRHMSSEKNIRWHIDRITVNAVNMSAYVSEGTNCVPECFMADIAMKKGLNPYIKGFGSSDCKCHTHLFKVTPVGRKEMISELGLTPFDMTPRVRD